MKDGPMHSGIRKLIDEREKKALGFFEKLSVFLHTAMCPHCREYNNRSLLLSRNFRKHNLHDQRLNSYQGAILHKSTSLQDRLASFPELNPSPIIEFEKSGRASYQNPAFFRHFPHLKGAPLESEFFSALRAVYNDLIDGSKKEFSTEILQENIHYSMRATYLGDLEVVRVFFLDITEQKRYEKIIHEKNKEITDSIQYAKRIQEAILPSEDYIKKEFSESFILYKPKDIVAGDFYWMSQNKDHLFLAAADCTGHGVPGALVSVVCSNALNRSVTEFSCIEPGHILDKTRELVLETLAGERKNVQDGMDISLVALNKKTGGISWSGANNPLWILSEGELRELKGDKQPVGKCDHPSPFTTRQVKYLKGDKIILFTDGYPDQFGGPEEKKFKYQQLKNLLLANVHLPMANFKEVLESTFENWKKDLEQTDDVLLMCVKP